MASRRLAAPLSAPLLDGDEVTKTRSRSYTPTGKRLKWLSEEPVPRLNRQRSNSKGVLQRRSTVSSAQMWSASAAFSRVSANSDVCTDLEDMLVSEAQASENCSTSLSEKDAISRKPSESELIGVETAATHDASGGFMMSVLFRMPGLLIGSMMNIMLSVPFGLAFFPAQWEPFPVPRAVGLQMFLFSTVICQVLMTLRSEFPCAMGMMMVENIPFMHTLAQNIYEVQGSGIDALATTMVAFALSTLMIGVAFLALGRYKLGKATNYFPRHFIIGCIGGIGIFVTQTGVEVSTGIPWSWTMDSFAAHSERSALYHLLAAAALVLILNIAIRLVQWPLLPPFFFVGITPVFYVVLLAMGVSADTAREEGWMFPHPPATSCLVMWSLFDFGVVRWDLILQSIPTMLALTCFGLMHAPINIPSLAMSTSLEGDMDEELIVHGWTNVVSGVFGGLPNYLCYSNSLLYFKCNGGGRASGVALSIILVGFFVVGPGVIAYIPRCMAGCLLIHVGLDLTREALVDSFDIFDAYEYSSVVLITLTMTACGMTTGLGLGIVLSAMSFTLQHMRHSEPVRGAMPATTLRSSKMFLRNRLECSILDDELRKVEVVQLQGTLFFGNATVLLSRCDEMLAEAKGRIQTLLLDFTLVGSLESSAAEAIAKIYQIAQKHNTALVYARGSTDGFPTSAPLSRRLEGMSASKGHGPQLFVADDLDEALAWIEDQILTSARQEGRLPVSAVPEEDVSPALSAEALALNQLQALAPNEDVGVLRRLLSLMECRKVGAGEMLWTQGEISDHCLLLSEGLLESRLDEEAGTFEDCEPGSLLGEYHFLTQEKRMQTLWAKKDSVVYTLASRQWEEILRSDPYVAYVVASISIRYLGTRCHHVSNRIWDTRCLPI
eukprot:TRINITY_DN19244_c0_g1_i1.p1 TRINITY_DN19244_c0_g1~~TRINITY_DN19244_c0_g1_i1.p1  ORF type:complete len:910 (-),score=86.92 TRINITY_DN19244_c0_g1_i1:146-2821(-)